MTKRNLFELSLHGIRDTAKFSWTYGDDGKPVGAKLEGLAAFRTGVHTDSRGNEHTWEPKDLRAMARNFKKLVEDNSFPDVPMRVDHSFSAESVIGYMTNVYTKGDKLLVDVDITEPEAAAKYERGTFRARSAEIGAMPDNEGRVLDNVFMGLAFVDIPAVTNLYSMPSEDLIVHRFVEAEGQTEPNQGDSKVEYTEEDLKAEFAKGKDAGLAAAKSEFVPQPPHKFRIAGEEVTNIEAVQSHIDALESYQEESVKAGRTAFVSALVQRNVIPVTQEESTVEFALGMNDVQFEQFKAIHAEMPENPLFAKHANSGGPEGQSNDSGPSEDEQAIATAREVVAMHRRAGVPEAEIALTPSFKRLEALKGA